MENSPRSAKKAFGQRQAEPYASLHSVFQSRQHAIRPDRRFHPGPAALGVSDLRSPYGHWRRLWFGRPVCHASTFLRSLRSVPVTALRRYYGRSDSCMAGSSCRQATMNAVPTTMQVSLLHVHGLADHSVSNHLTFPAVALARYPLARRASSASRRSGLRRSLAGSPKRPAESSSSPTDWSFVSCCFPPRLAATQLPSTTGRRAHAWGGLAPP